MNNRFLLFQWLVILLFVLGAACTPAPESTAGEAASATSAEDDHADDGHGHEEGDEHGEGEAGHGVHAHVDPPEEFASLTNPFAGDHEAIEAGEAIYNTNCATCHGPKGMGDGEAAEALDPKPAALGDPMMMAEMSDGYMFWRVTSGGILEPFNSAMPAWEAVLSADQRWQVISYVRTFAGDEHMEMEGSSHDHDDEHMDEHMDEHEGEQAGDG